jgi:hypothetical protein
VEVWYRSYPLEAAVLVQQGVGLLFGTSIATENEWQLQNRKTSTELEMLLKKSQKQATIRAALAGKDDFLREP